MTNFDTQINIYISCFSEKIKKLALWRYYAENGSGFAIGFNQNFQKVESSNITPEHRVISKVIYGKEEGENFVKEFIREYLKFFEEADHKLKKDSCILFWKKLDIRLIAHLISILPSLKDDSFEDEKEVRIFRAEGQLLNYFINDKYRKFIPISKKFIPFVHSLQGNKPVILPDEFFCSDISEIWIGPNCEFLEARSWIRKLLSKYGYDLTKVKIKAATLPYKVR